MATPLITPELYSAKTGQTFTGASLTSIAEICASVSDVLERYLRPYSATPITLTNFVMDAPTRNVLISPVLPVRSITSLSLHWYADGQVANFTADDLLVVGDDYLMPVSPFTGFSEDGKIFRRGSSTWAFENVHPERTSLAPVISPNRGAILISGTFGELTIPDGVTEAARIMVARLYAGRRTGMVFGSENWNGYGYSYPGPLTALAALDLPDVQAALLLFRKTVVHCASD